MTDFSPVPGGGMTGADPFMKKMLQTADESRAYSKSKEAELAASQAREDEARKRQATIVAPKQKELAEKLHAGAPAAPQEKPLPATPPAPRLDPQQMKETLGLITFLAAMGGALTRTPLTAALNNFAAGVDGLHKGQQDVYQQQMKEFDANLKKANAENETLWKKYEAASKKFGTDIKGLTDEIKLIAAESQSQIDLELAKQGRIVDLIKMHEKANSDFATVMGHAATARQTALAHEETARHNRATEAVAQKKLANTEALAQGNFTEADVAYWSEVMQNGGSLPPRLTTTPGGKKLVSDIMKHVAASGTSPSEMLTHQAELMGLKAAERTVGTRGANVEMAASEAREMADIVRSTSKEFSRTFSRDFNEAIGNLESRTGGVGVKRLRAAINSYVNAYARAISPSGTPTVSDKEHARDVLSHADSEAQLNGILDVLDSEMSTAQHAPQRTKAALRANATGKPSDSGSIPDGWTVTEH